MAKATPSAFGTSPKCDRITFACGGGRVGVLMNLLLEIQQYLNKLTWLLKVKAVTRVNFKELDIVDERTGSFRVFVVHGCH